MSTKILLNKSGNGFRPFINIEDAEKFIDSQKDLNGEVIEVDGGFGIMKLAQKANSTERYFLCNIPPRTNPEDLDVIHLSLNGYLLSVRRGIDVILPERLIEVADNAVRKTYEIKDSTTIYTGSIAVCPVMRKKEVSEKEFREQCKDGNTIRDKEIRDKLARG